MSSHTLDPECRTIGAGRFAAEGAQRGARRRPPRQQPCAAVCLTAPAPPGAPHAQPAPPPTLTQPDSAWRVASPTRYHQARRTGVSLVVPPGQVRAHGARPRVLRPHPAAAVWKAATPWHHRRSAPLCKVTRTSVRALRHGPHPSRAAHSSLPTGPPTRSARPPPTPDAHCAESSACQIDALRLAGRPTCSPGELDGPRLAGRPTRSSVFAFTAVRPPHRPISPSADTTPSRTTRLPQWRPSRLQNPARRVQHRGPICTASRRRTLPRLPERLPTVRLLHLSGLSLPESLVLCVRAPLPALRSTNHKAPVPAVHAEQNDACASLTCIPPKTPVLTISSPAQSPGCILFAPPSDRKRAVPIVRGPSTTHFENVQRLIHNNPFFGQDSRLGETRKPLLLPQGLPNVHAIEYHLGAFLTHKGPTLPRGGLACVEIAYPSISRGATLRRSWSNLKHHLYSPIAQHGTLDKLGAHQYPRFRA